MTVSTCQDVADLVTSYLEEALPPDDRLAFERHVAICPPCRGYLSQMRVVIRAGGSLREVELPEPVRVKLLDAFAGWRDRSEK